MSRRRRQTGFKENSQMSSITNGGFHFAVIEQILDSVMTWTVHVKNHISFSLLELSKIFLPCNKRLNNAKKKNKKTQALLWPHTLTTLMKLLNCIDYLDPVSIKLTALLHVLPWTELTGSRWLIMLRINYLYGFIDFHVWPFLSIKSVT